MCAARCPRETTDDNGTYCSTSTVRSYMYVVHECMYECMYRVCSMRVLVCGG